MSIQLASDLESFVRDRVASGKYGNEAEVIRTAFTLLERREQLLDHIDVGTEQLRRGECIEFTNGQQSQTVSDTIMQIKFGET